MCLICVEFQKERMTFDEAIDAFREVIITIDKDHAEKLLSMLVEYWITNLEVEEEE